MEMAAAFLNLSRAYADSIGTGEQKARYRSALRRTPMRALSSDENLCNDKWLAALVDAMDEVEAERAEDICRGSYVPAGLMDQLYGRTASPRRTVSPRFEVA
jgi:hypothetical protein